LYHLTVISMTYEKVREFSPLWGARVIFDGSRTFGIRTTPLAIRSCAAVAGTAADP
jgi:hypothetical protein